METKNARGSNAPTSSTKKGPNNSSITMFFKKAQTGQANADIEHENRTSNKAISEEQIAAIPKIQQKEPSRVSQSSAAVHNSPSKDHQSKRSSANTPKKQNSKQENNADIAVQSTNDQTLTEKASVIKDDITDHKIREFQEEIQDEINSDPSELQNKRSLRPKKIQNYRKLLEGDEITLKTIEDEQMEIKKKLVEDGDEDEEEFGIGQIERASDDDEEDEDFMKKTNGGAASGQSKGKRKLRKVIDDDLNEEELEESESDDQDALMDDLENEDISLDGSKRKKKEQYKKQQKKGRNKADDADLGEDEEDTVFIDNLPQDEQEIKRMLREVKKHIKTLEKQFFEEEDSEQEEELKSSATAEQHDEKLMALQENSHIKQFWCIPLSIDVRTDIFDRLAESQMKMTGRLFDVITIDPPWQLSSANPTRGVAIAYETLNDREILSLPFNKIQTDGFLFIWVINAKYRFALQMMEEFGYKLVDEIAWVKQTVNGKIAKGHGYYLQHAKETCLVGVKGNVKGRAKFNIESDVIFSQRRGQSQKPEEIYEIAEALVPNGYYIEIFGRRNNLHNGWVTVGNEI